MLESNATGLPLGSWRRSPLIQEASSTDGESQASCRFNVPKIKSLSNNNIRIKNSIHVIIIHNNAVKVATWFHYCLCSNPCPLSGHKMTRPFRREHTIRWRKGICDEFLIIKSLIYLHDGRGEPASYWDREEIIHNIYQFNLTLTRWECADDSICSASWGEI